MEVARVVLASGQAALAEEVMHFIDRTGRSQVVASASDERQVREAVRQSDADVVVVTPELIDAVAGVTTRARLLVLDSSESVGGLRAAVRSGADGFIVWPADRDELAAACAGSVARAVPRTDGGSSQVIGVHGSRGGAGATFLATHLADAVARLGKRCVLVEADPVFGDVAVALGAARAPSARSIEDLLPVMAELGTGHVEGVLWEHARGFRVLLPPRSVEAALGMEPAQVLAAVEALRPIADVVIVHLPRSLPWAEPILANCDQVVSVLSLDVLSFASARRTMEAAGPAAAAFGYVVNRATRGEIVPGDVARVFGREALGVIPEDRAVQAAQDRGALLSPRSRAARAVTQVATRLISVEAEVAA